MLTNPSTLGLFEEDIVEIAGAVHDAGGLLYYDGANLNAILGVVRPGDMGFDIVHLNVHKTFATPHGGGGPGAGPVAVDDRVADFLPGPRPVRLGDGSFGYATPPRSVGRVHSWHGNALVLLRAWAYLRLNGADGLRHVAETAVLNANWLKEKLRGVYDLPYDRTVMHECVVSARSLEKATGLRALDVGKAPLGAGLPRPDGVLPPHRRRGAHDRAHRDREPTDGGGPRRGSRADRDGGERRPAAPTMPSRRPGRPRSDGSTRRGPRRRLVATFDQRPVEVLSGGC